MCCRLALYHVFASGQLFQIVDSGLHHPGAVLQVLAAVECPSVWILRRIGELRLNRQRVNAQLFRQPHMRRGTQGVVAGGLIVAALTMKDQSAVLGQQMQPVQNLYHLRG